MVQKTILKREQNEEFYDNVNEVLNLHIKAIRQRKIISSVVREKLYEFYRKNDVNREEGNRPIGSTMLEEFNNNTNDTQFHALQLIGYRTINPQGEIEFKPRINIKLIGYFCWCWS